MPRSFAIVTTCKGRLDHLKASHPAMVSQACNEVIVVDYSCPDKAGEFVASNFPQVRVVTVEGEETFSNWKARNAGAASATSDVLVFVDGDTILAPGAIEWMAQHLRLKTCGFFNQKTSMSFNRSETRLAANQLRGFQAISTPAFRRLGGYDEVLEGYAAGADTDMEERLALIGHRPFNLSPTIIQQVLDHDAASRTQFHRHPVRTTYCAGLLYRGAKRVLLRMHAKAELPLAVRRDIYQAAMQAAAGIGSTADRVGLTVKMDENPVLMPRQLGYEDGSQTLSLKVEVSMRGKLSRLPE